MSKNKEVRYIDQEIFTFERDPEKENELLKSQISNLEQKIEELVQKFQEKKNGGN